MKNIKLIVFDVDGVLTDGKLYIGSDGEEYKAFHTQDGMGISLARYTGVKTAIITGRKSEAVTKRAKELKFDYVHQGIHDKLTILKEMASPQVTEEAKQGLRGSLIGCLRSTIRIWAQRRRNRQDLLNLLDQDHRTAGDMGTTTQELEAWAKKPFWLP